MKIPIDTRRVVYAVKALRAVLAAVPPATYTALDVPQRTALMIFALQELERGEVLTGPRAPLDDPDNPG